MEIYTQRKRYKDGNYIQTTVQVLIMFFSVCK